MNRSRTTGMLLAIFAIAAIGYFVGAALGLAWVTWITKPVPVLCLIPLAFLWSPTRNRYTVFLAIGFVFSVCGDILLMFPESGAGSESSIDFFMFGLIAFLIGHLFYAVAFSLKDRMGSGNRPPLAPVRVVPFILFAIPTMLVLWPNLGAMAIPVLVYMLVILSMGWRASARVGFATENKSAQWAGCIGAISFILSDTIIAMNKFHEPIEGERYLIMITYWAGQLLIARSVHYDEPASE